ncbi:MAG: Uma2 family endonuclease [Caulobacterales bacterium]|nr:Uma2 family endonuclease [Caulobacterales bacterium]
MTPAGVLPPDGRFELIAGEIVPISPMRMPPAKMTRRLATALEKALGPSFLIRPGVTVRLSAENQFDPDITVVDADFAGDIVPVSAARLIVEVADTTLTRDLGRKAPLYAAAGLAELWVADLASATTHRHRGPLPDAWREVVRLPFGEPLAPECAPDASLTVAALR